MSKGCHALSLSFGKSSVRDLSYLQTQLFGGMALSHTANAPETNPGRRAGAAAVRAFIRQRPREGLRCE